MERNTITTISTLRFGDRFYKTTDKNKEVWQKVSFNNRRYECKRDKDLHPTPMAGNTNVVFLRANN